MAAVSADAAPRCTAELAHAHGTSVCDQPTGHDGQHSALCEACIEDGYDDPSDRLEWDEQHENWLTRRA